MLAKAKAELIVVAIIAAVLFCVLMISPVTGVADNGDFARIMNSVGLSHISDDYNDKFFGYVNRGYKITGGTPFDGGYISSEVPLVMLAVAASKTLTGSEIFDIRYLSVIYCIVFVFGIYLISRSVGRISVVAFIPLSLLLIFSFTDIGYIAYFNSFYGEALSISFFVLLAAAVLYLITSSMKSGEAKLWPLVIFYMATGFFMTAKVQNIPAGFIILLFGVGFLRLRKDTAWRSVIAVASLLILSFSIFTFASVSQDIKTCNKYQTIFYGILKDSPDPVSDLKELGLNTDYAVLAGSHYFLEEYPLDIRSVEFKSDIYENVGYVKVAGFYLRHPERLVQKLQTAAANAFSVKTGFGNFEKGAGLGYKAVADHPDGWSDFKEARLPHNLVFLIWFFTLAMLFLCIFHMKVAGEGINIIDPDKNDSNKKGRLILIEFLAAILLISLSQLLLPLLGDGEADISKHLFLFNFTFDILFISLWTLAVAGIAKVAGDIRCKKKSQCLLDP